jgi:tRNA nucleotidyltransferase (CCA-adding enzyme)
MYINIPNEVLEIFSVLKNNGYKYYIVGGCVRDSLLNIKPKDWDICTDALPEQMLDIFKNYKTIPTGLKHGTITIVINNVQFEVTTFRIDGKYLDNRRPNNVDFTSSLYEDLSRRDITINAMAYNYKDGLIDYFGGKQDLENYAIKCVGNPYERLEVEDRLRKLRVIRFAAVLSFIIDVKVIPCILKYFSSILSYSIQHSTTTPSLVIVKGYGEYWFITSPSTCKSIK